MQAFVQNLSYAGTIRCKKRPDPSQNASFVFPFSWKYFLSWENLLVYASLIEFDLNLVLNTNLSNVMLILYFSFL